MRPSWIVSLVPLVCAGLIACRRGDPAKTPASAVPLTETEWVLVELAGAPAPPGAGGNAATLVFSGTDGRAAGFAGCNRFSGAYQHAGDSLTIGPVAMTRMACDAGMDLEQRYAATLATVRRYRLTGTTLELLGDGGVAARFSVR